MTKDLTQGSPVRLILGFALPLLAGMLFQQLYNLVDTLIVGRFLGMEALAGVGATGSINFLVLGFCMGVCSGFAIPVAQQFGAREESRMREFVANGTWLSIVFDRGLLRGYPARDEHADGLLRAGLRLHCRHFRGHSVHVPV